MLHGDSRISDTEQHIRLKQAAVFAHSAETVAGGIFQGVENLLRNAAPEDNNLAQEGNMAPEASTSTDAGSVHNATSASRLTTTRTRQPCNEYSNNADYLYGAF